MSNEAEAAKPAEETPENPGRPVFKLRRTVKFEDVERSELALDLEGLNGRDLQNAYSEAQIARGGKQVMSPIADKVCQAHIAARAAGVPVGLIEHLAGKDYEDVTGAVFIFFAV